MPERQIYLLDPKNLSAETIAVTFAKTSRSPLSFRQIAAELTDAKSADFNEKWVVGYGHASVAEHAVLHIAAENISRLAVECLESNRLASYTEKSTRYQRWEPDAYHTPVELDAHPGLRAAFTAGFRTLYDAYHTCLQALRPLVMSECPRLPAEPESAWDRRVQQQVVDVCRFLLPGAVLANVGMTLNARALEHALCKMLSHPLAEVRAIGEEIKQAALEQLPTLVKYADALPYLTSTRQALEADAAQLPPPAPADWCQLVAYDTEGEDRVLAAALYRFGHGAYTQCIQHVRQASAEERARLASHVLQDFGAHDIPLRELEYASLTFDITIDQGAYAELKRHRMMTQTPQAPTPYLGYALPRRISSAGLEPVYRAALHTARDVFEQIAEINPQAAAYIIPNACNRRVLLQTNVRSAAHFISLRSAPNAHFSIRRLAQRMAEQVGAASPLLAAALRANPAETWQQIEAEHFTATAE